MLPCLPDTLTPDQQGILTTLRTLAGLVVHAIQHLAALTDEREMTTAGVTLLFWRNNLLRHTCRLLPGLLVKAGEDLEAPAHHSCDPQICTHEAHERG